MKATLLLTLVSSVLALALMPSPAQSDVMLGNVHGMVLQQGRLVAGALVELVIFADDDNWCHGSARTNDRGAYRIERMPYGVGRGKLSTADSRGPAPEPVEIDKMETALNFKL